MRKKAMACDILIRLGDLLIPCDLNLDETMSCSI